MSDRNIISSNSSFEPGPKGFTENVGTYAPMGEEFDWFSGGQTTNRGSVHTDGGVNNAVGWYKARIYKA